MIYPNSLSNWILLQWENVLHINRSISKITGMYEKNLWEKLYSYAKFFKTNENTTNWRKIWIIMPMKNDGNFYLIFIKKFL